MGQSPPGESYNSEGLGMPFFQGKAEFGDRYPTPSKWCDAPTRLAEAGDILLSVRAPVGPINFAKENCCIGRGLAAIRANKSLLDQSYLYYVFRFIEPSISSKGQGSTFSAINKSDIEKISFPLPSLSEQRKIVEILDQADALRKKRAESDRLSDRILPALFIKMFGDPVVNSCNLKTVPLGEIASFVGGGTPSRKIPEYFEGTTCWATSKDMGVDVLKDTQEHITVEAITNSATKLVKSGCLLIVVKSKILARYLPVARTEVDTCFGQDLKAIVPHNQLLVRYLHRHLQIGQKTLLKMARGVNTEGLTLEHLRNYPVLIPEENNKLKLFSEWDKHLETLRYSRVTSHDRLEDLFKTLLHQAFTGTLTASWRTAHMTELLQEMEHQAKQLNLDLSPTP